MSPASRNYALLCLNLVLWAVNALTFTGTIHLSAKSGIPVTLEIEPMRARITVSVPIGMLTVQMDGLSHQRLCDWRPDNIKLYWSVRVTRPIRLKYS